MIDLCVLIRHELLIVSDIWEWHVEGCILYFHLVCVLEIQNQSVPDVFVILDSYRIYISVAICSHVGYLLNWTILILFIFLQT